MMRTTLIRQARLFSTSATRYNVVKDAAKKVDRTVSDTLVKGIEKGEQATEAAKSAAGINAAEAQGKASEISGKASEVAGQAKGKASELAGEAKGKAAEVKGEAKAKMG